MSANIIEHRGIVQRVEGGKAVVAMETAGCGSCKQGTSCGIGQLASGRAATLLTLPASADIKAGDVVSIALPESRLTISALFGYLFPAIAMLFGAWFGASMEGGSDGSTALGAMAGFLGALASVRIVVGMLPNLMPAPQMIPLSDPSALSQQEFHHE
jgi:sigma-E factor negative regulatory protein RseC